MANKGIFIGKKINCKNITNEKLYKTGITKNGDKWHSLVVTDFHKDQTGTYITDAYYRLWFFCNQEIFPYDVFSITKINKIESNKFLNHNNQLSININVYVEISIEDKENKAVEYSLGQQNNFDKTYNMEDEDNPF